jgi:hypothetical protein
MSDHAEESSDQTEEIVHELLVAQRHQEITQTTTLQGQIVALVLILRDAGILTKSQVNDWETMAEKVAALLCSMAKANEMKTGQGEGDLEHQITTLLEGMEATIEFTKMMGNSDEVLAPLIQERDRLSKEFDEWKSGT